MRWKTSEELEELGEKHHREFQGPPRSQKMWDDRLLARLAEERKNKPYDRGYKGSEMAFAMYHGR